MMMIDEADSELSDVDPEEVARQIQDLDDLDADMFGLKVTKSKSATIKTSSSAGKTSSPTLKTTEALSGKSRLLAEMFPARSDWLGLQDESKETAVSNNAPISPLAPRPSQDSAPFVATAARQSPTERPKFTPTPRRARSGPSDPLGLFQESHAGQPNPSRPDPALPSWLGGAQTTLVLESPVHSPSRNNSKQEDHGSSLQPVKPDNNVFDQPRQPNIFVEQKSISPSSTDLLKEPNTSLSSRQQINNLPDQNKQTTSYNEPSRGVGEFVEKPDFSNNFQTLPQKFSTLTTNSHQKPLQESSNAQDQTQLFTNFQYQPKNFTNVQDQLVKTKSLQNQTVQPNILSELQRLSTDTQDISRQPSTLPSFPSQSISSQDKHEAALKENSQKSHPTDLPLQHDGSRSPSPQQQSRSNHDRWEGYESRSTNRDQRKNHEDNRHDRDWDLRRERDLRFDLESRLERDSRLERLLETLISRSSADAQLEGQRVRRELDVLAVSLRDEMAALASSRRRDMLDQEVAQGEQREVARGMEALGSQLKGLAEALAEQRQCWQRDTTALQAALVQRLEPEPVQQGTNTQKNITNIHSEYQDKIIEHQRDALTLQASQAYFAQDVKQEIRSSFKDLHQEIGTVSKLNKQDQQEFVEKVERERALLADEMRQGRDLLVREIKHQEEAMAERVNTERVSFSEDMRRQRQEFKKEMEVTRQECFDAMRKELDSFNGMLRRERANFHEELKQERATFLAELLKERNTLTTHTSAEVSRFSDRLATSASALAAEMQRERDALAEREMALAERESAVRHRNESLASAARELQRMAAAAVDARDQGNAALTAAERIEVRECARAAELSAQLAQLRDVERARVARRLAQARQHAGFDGDRSPAAATKISLMRLQAQHNFAMIETDTQLFESLCSVSK